MVGAFLMFSNHKNTICSQSHKSADLIIWKGKIGGWSLCFESAFVSRELSLTNRSILCSRRAHAWLQERMYCWQTEFQPVWRMIYRRNFSQLPSSFMQPHAPFVCTCPRVFFRTSAYLHKPKGLRYMCTRVRHLGQLKENWYKLTAASAPQTEMTGVMFSRSLLDASLFNPISSLLRNSFSLPGKSRSFYLMWCFYVQFPSSSPIIGRHATVAGDKAMDSQHREQSKLGETFKRSHLFKLWKMSNGNVTQRTYLLQLHFQTIME